MARPETGRGDDEPRPEKQNPASVEAGFVMPTVWSRLSAYSAILISASGNTQHAELRTPLTFLL